MASVIHPLTPRDTPRLVSLVLPVYNEAEVLPTVFQRIETLFRLLNCECEAIFVNDGSSDETIWLLLQKARTDSRIKVIGLSRNCGHQIAATAGLDCASGDAIVLMDGDLQDPPELVIEMLNKYREGYDVVYARRIAREGETFFKRSTAWLFYRMMRALIHRDLPTDVGDFRLMSRNSLDALRSMREVHRFLRGMVTWCGFSQTHVDFVRPARIGGQTKYPFRKMLAFAWNAAVSFSPLPLRLSFALGFTLLSIGIAYSCFGLYKYLFGGHVVPGWTSLLVLNCITSGAAMLGIGVLGEYVGRTFEEIKARPLYFVSVAANLDAATVPPRSISSARPIDITTGGRKSSSRVGVC